MDDKIGMRRGLTSYGDEDFSLYLRIYQGDGLYRRSSQPAGDWNC
jgi:hypothetical protein